MIIVRVSPNRLLIINEYWIFIPLGLYIEYLFIKRVNRIKATRLKKKEVLEVPVKTSNNNSDYLAKSQLLKIFHLSMGNLMGLVMIRGGQEVIELVEQACSVGKGLSYVNDHKIRTLLHKFFPKKVRRGVLYITRMALCYFIKQKTNRALMKYLPLPLENAILINDYFETTVKLGIVSLFVGGLSTFYHIYTLGGSWVSVGIAVILVMGGVVGVKYDFNYLDTSPISMAEIPVKARIKNIPEVVSVNLQPESIPKLQYKPQSAECVLADQRAFNPKCKLSATEIAEISNKIALESLTYEKVVNMQDVTSLHKTKFLDRYEVYQVPSSTKVSHGTGKVSKKVAKMVKFLDKFGDPDNIPENQSWDTETNSIKQTLE